jgi:hypothetical protein
MVDRVHDLTGPGQRFIEVVRVDDVGPGDVLFRLNKRPSVMTGSPSLPRSTVAASGPWSWPPKTNVPLASISTSRATTPSMNVSISSGVLDAPGASPSTA